MGYKNTSAGWKLSTSIHWPKLVLQFFTLWLRFQLDQEIFPNHVPIWINICASTVTNFYNALFIYLLLYLPQLDLHYLYIHGIPIRYQFNSTKCTGRQSCASHTTECWYCELCRVSSLVLFNCLSPIFLSIMTHQCVHWLWWD